MGDYPKALSILKRALSALRALGDRSGAATVLSSIGSVHDSVGSYAKALSTYERTLAVRKALGEKSAEAAALGNIGRVHRALGNHAKALSLHERALSAYEALGSRPGVARALAAIGVDHYEVGDYAKALSIQARALEMQEALGDKDGAAAALGNLGGVHHALGEYRTSLRFHERALSAHEAIGGKAGAALSLGNIGVVQHSLGNYAKALAAYGRALAAQGALGDKAGTASTLVGVGLAHIALGETAEARRALERSARAARKLRATPIRLKALKGIALLHLKAGESSRALSAAQRALEVTEGMLGGLGEEQATAARGRQTQLFAVGALAAVEEGDAAEALTFMESGRAGALLDALGKREALRWKAESLPEELRRQDEVAQAAQNVARHHYDLEVKRGNRKATRTALRSLDDATDVVREVAGRIQRELKRQAGLFYPRAETIENIESALEKDQALVLYALCMDEALALVLRQDGERVIKLGKAMDVQAACAALQPVDVDVDATKALARLRALLVDPLKLGEGVKQVLISPEGPLCYLPFGALFPQTVAMTPSGTTHVLLLDEEREPGKGILSLGNPDYSGISEGARAVYYRGRTLAALPATGDEVEAIGTRTLLGAKASEAGLREHLTSAKRWKAVHFACHGLIDVERPMLSSLALSRSGEDDGFLTALEVLRMEIPADLAVLSACETGKGRVVKGEGIVGLTRAFMFAGAPRVICSLWKVDDEATRTLMIKFYELWNPKDGSRGLGAAAALKEAQVFVRGHDQWKHPYFWAAWVLWGLPS